LNKKEAASSGFLSYSSGRLHEPVQTIREPGERQNDLPKLKRFKIPAGED